MFRAVDLIIKKRNGDKLSKEEIGFLVKGTVDGSIPEYQMSAFLMAVFFNGMDFEETSHLTQHMIDSGKIFNLSKIDGIKVDKHSTGGVGDKITLILAPLVAACGAPVPTVTGRGLGHTGGTLDKLASIPGFRTGLTEKELVRQVSKIGAAIIGQTDSFVPADKKLYALRDLTGTVESIPLITASILSKKFASGVDAIVMDVKFGNGAFMQNLAVAEKLSNSLVETGKKLKKDVVAVLTDMNRPLGKTIGNSLEIIETVETLKGKGPDDINEITIFLAGYMLTLAGVAKNIDEGKRRAEENLFNGKALDKFRKIVELQGGDVKIIDKPELLDVSDEVHRFKAKSSGYIKLMDTRAIGNAAMMLGAGRLKLEDKIDVGVGFYVNKKTGDAVQKGDTIMEIYHRKGKNLKEVVRLLEKSVIISESKVKPPELIKKIIK